MLQERVPGGRLRQQGARGRLRAAAECGRRRARAQVAVDEEPFLNQHLLRCLRLRLVTTYANHHQGREITTTEERGMGVRPALLEGWLQQKYPGLSLQHQRQIACSFPRTCHREQNRILQGRRGRRDISDPRYAYKSGTGHEFMGVRASIQSCRSACGICTCKWHDA
jgi:hypothetical protein